MADDDEIEALKVLCALLWRRLDRMAVLTETLRELLERHGVLSAAEIEALSAEGERIQRLSMLETMLKGADAAHAAILRRLLERFEGPPQ